jgi:kynureninase
MSFAIEAAELDAADPLAAKRAEFDLDPAVTYLDGNSLGAPPRHVAERLDEVVREQWGRGLIRSWKQGWWDAPERIGDRIAPLVGTGPGRVVVCDSTSVNLFKALAAAIRLRPGRPEILVDAATFPTDGYMAAGLAGLSGHTVRRVAAGEMAAAASERTAVALINHVDYVTAELRDMGAITGALHRVGALALWDLCHSVGALPVELDAHDVDLAVGCTYKFLNGGPGSPAFLYVAGKWLDGFEQPLSGWAGHRDPFGMTETYEGKAGIGRARSGTPDILSLLALDAALDVWRDVSLVELRRKSLSLGDFFARCLEELIPDVRILTPRGHGRGSQLSVAGSEKTMDELISRGVIGDFRPPAVLRFGLTPLYTRYVDVLRAANELAQLTESNEV